MNGEQEGEGLKGREWLAEDTKDYNIYERKIMELEM